MTAKLRIELENATGKGFDELTKDIEKMGVKGEDTQKALELLHKEMQSRASAKLSEQMRQLADESDDTADALRKAKAEQQKLDDAFRASYRSAVDNNKALQELNDTAMRAARSAGKAAEFHRDLQQAMNERKVRAYRAEINRLADEMSDGGKKASAFGKSLSAIGAAGGAAGGTLIAAAVAAKLSWEGAKIAAEGVNLMAERGIPAAVELRDAWVKFQESLIDIGADPSIQTFMNDLTLAIKVGLIPAVEDATWAFSALAKAGSYAMHQSFIAAVGVAESFGAVEKGTTGKIKFAMQLVEQLQERQAKANEKANAARAAQREKDRQAQKDEREGELANPGKKMREDQARTDRLDAIKGVQGQAQLEREINELLAKQAAKIAEIKKLGFDPTTDREVLQNAKMLTELETRRAAIIKERLDKQKEKEKELKDARMAGEKKAFDEEIKHIDTLLRESTQSADKIKELEQRRFALVKENKERERKLAIEAGTLEQKLFEEDMARIELRKKKEREAALAGIENERKLYLAREHRRDLERQAEQEKIDKFKEFLTGGGGDSFSFGGNSGNTQFTFAPTFTGGSGGGGECCCPCPGGGMGGGGMPVPMGGMPSMPQMPMQPQMPFYPPMMPPMWQGPNVPMPQGWHGQTPWPGGPPKPRPNPLNALTGGITPRNVWDQTVKNAQDEEEKKRIAEGQASGKLDQNGNPIDYKKEEEREKSKYVREKIAQGFGLLGIDIGQQQNLGDEQKPRAGWNNIPTTFSGGWFGDPDGQDPRGQDVRDPSGKTALKNEKGNFIPVDSPEGQKILQAQKNARDKKLKDAAEARKQVEGDPYKKIQELNKQEEEQQRKKDAAEQTRKQGEADKSDSLPELKKKEEEESKKLADIQKAKNEELKKVREFEEKRRQESSDRTKDAKAKNEEDRKFDKEQEDSKRKFEDWEDMDARWTWAEHEDDGTKPFHVGRFGQPASPLNSEKREAAAKAKADKRREKERQFSPDTGPETPKQRADARKLAQARGRAAEKKNRAQTKTKKLQQGKRGQITGVETTRAYHDVVQQQQEALRAQGQVGATEIEALQQLLDGYRESAQTAAEHQQKLNEILDAIYEIRGFRPPKGRRQAGR